jgi:predicted HAD superfamily phosphohydrolase
MWCWHQWSNWAVIVLTVGGVETSQQVRACCRCEKTEVKFICVGDLIAAEQQLEPQPEGRLH